MVAKLAKTATRPRGRPRAYDAETALQRARDIFWRSGYAATSLDEIAAATGMNRPSLRAAFGDKHALYLATLDAYWDRKAVTMRDALGGGTVEAALMRAYGMALDTYFSGGSGARGCFVVATAITEAAEDADPRALAQLATATMHSMAVRARAGAPRDELWSFAGKAVRVICAR